MQIANVWLKIDGSGSNIQLSDVTPAEAAVLNADHEANAKGVAVHDVVVTREEERTGEAEINRLREKYANAKNKKGDQWATILYPGKNPVLPQTFKEVGLESTPSIPVKAETKAPQTKPSPAEAPAKPAPAPTVEPTK